MSARRFLFALTAALLPATAMAEAVHTAKSPTCGCCGAWVEHMAMAGHDVSVEDMGDDALAELKVSLGIPDEMVSCHTAMVDGYVVEGHVPATDVERLLSERPDAIGLSVPGMVMGTPGMGPREDGEAFDVWLMKRDWTAEVFAAYPEG
ncbi:DUF411 domain-containing protein [Jannaschia rubra]|uniref:Metal-binding protein n=1 Tax=Jannaschia rubra TaxID=282197 RepID=A0A0M6XWU2_9RHOB|nr:DUF411 domain-containing protein [Jannaschia rubra]CTQ34555.1 Protein of unknown function, DUF [Jannaschia rubra]